MSSATFSHCGEGIKPFQLSRGWKASWILHSRRRQLPVATCRINAERRTTRAGSRRSYFPLANAGIGPISSWHQPGFYSGKERRASAHLAVSVIVVLLDDVHHLAANETRGLVQELDRSHRVVELGDVEILEKRLEDGSGPLDVLFVILPLGGPSSPGTTIACISLPASIECSARTCQIHSGSQEHHGCQ